MPKIQTTVVYDRLETAVKSGFTTISAQGSARSSKTYNILIWLVRYCLANPNVRITIVRATLPAIRRTVFIDFKEILFKFGVFDESRLNKAEFTYRFPNGSWVEFFSADSEQKLRGGKRDVLFVNEANELRPIEFRQLKMRTTRFAIIDYNPSFPDDHWICEVNKDSRTCHFVTTYKDNPFLEQVVVDEIESLRWSNQSLWRIYGLGMQADIEGLIFRNVEKVDAIPPHVKRRWCGVDFGYTNDPTAICEVALLDNVLYVDEICYKTQMLSSDIIRVLKAECSRLKIISESADPRLIQEIYRAGINIHPVKKFPGSVEAGISKMLELRICVTKRSDNVVKEFKNYTYRQDKEGKWLNEPIDCYNHAIDGIRYVVMSEVLGGERKRADLARLARYAH
jgi:phage terminase large subunit